MTTFVISKTKVDANGNKYIHAAVVTNKQNDMRLAGICIDCAGFSRFRIPQKWPPGRVKKGEPPRLFYALWKLPDRRGLLQAFRLTYAAWARHEKANFYQTARDTLKRLEAGEPARKPPRIKSID